MPSQLGADLPPLSDKSIALVHEWFGAVGGAENVLLAMHDVIPQAKGFVLWRDRDTHRGAEFQESWLARTPLRHAKPLALPLMPLAWRTLTRKHFDVVISSSHAFAHTVKIGSAEGTRYLSYVHSPARYIWSPSFDGRGSHALLTLPRKALQVVDMRLSRHVHSYAANSNEVQSRIQRFWKRDAHVIHPPVDVDYFGAAPASQRTQERRYLLGVGRWIPYKNFDLMIQIAEAARLPLIIAGAGSMEVELRRAAAAVTVPVSFERRPTQERLRELYWGAKALLFPAREDFGIVPVEAMACGTPVLGLRAGGLLDTVVDGKTGFLIDSADPRQYAARIQHVNELDQRVVSDHASGFSVSVFRTRLASWLVAEGA